ncbi:DNA polymerase-3 subunit epsilon [Amycolatopsis xylanica]|uniref:DNA polymerase-3 subunit epsilon n=1 Tax=Amycolatopsis xylanica TaxID=589385 RepID=A0A1H3STY5_9PSEU|nr:exonuclease domain-containing protein [Amycolatopsis xylanica]SDZ41432.1 DNA polymerase-3 subunit epsilon [Amycolatopsis xylanica]
MAGYAVVDLETTGLDSTRRDRIVELSVVHVSPTGEITGQWETLINPRRDLGPQRIHRVTAAQILRAPTFDQVAGELARLLAGRVVVAHNLRFDGGFLASEYARHGYRVPLGPHVGMCTMQLGQRYLPGAGRSLADCCAAFGITIEDAHRASADAFATARLLGGYLRMDPEGPRWRQELELAAEHPWPAFTVDEAPWMAREHAEARDEHFLARLVENLPTTHADGEQTAYLASLDQALLDRHISVAEADALVTIAAELGIDRITATGLHRAYLGQLATAALVDGRVTTAELADLRQVGDLLGLTVYDVDHALRDAPRGRPPVIERFVLERGDRVVFTGEMSQPRPDWEQRALDAGLNVHPAVTKKVKLLVAADPDTLSGKGRKARDYGIPVITEDAFAGMLDRGL